MDSKKFQQAFDSLLNDFNTRIDEVKSNIQNLTADVKSTRRAKGKPTRVW